MNCTNCGATTTPACVERGACTYCGAAVQPTRAIQAAQSPSLQHGVAEILQAMGQGETGNVQTFVSSSIVINGRTYRSVDELPPHLRATFEQGMRQAQQALGALESNVMIQSITTQASFEVPVRHAGATAHLPAPAMVESVGEVAVARNARRIWIFIALAVVFSLGALGVAMALGLAAAVAAFVVGR